MDCIFCKIASGEIKGNVVFRNDRVTAFRDLNPQAPIHILIIPNEHVPGVGDMSPEQAAAVADLVRAARGIAEQEGIAESGFRLVFNSGPDANQTVDHLHMHLIGGRAMQWPPG
ncbi:MAG TPA: histidine triad nucleotide-binding protein [Chloroflexota bacterium]